MSSESLNTEFDFHGYAGRRFLIDGREARVVAPKTALPDRPWIWRILFWDAFSNADVALLDRGFHVAFIEILDTFETPEALEHLDALYREVTSSATFNLSPHPVLEGLSRAGIPMYRWAAAHPELVSCLYGDAVVCEMRTWRDRPSDPPNNPIEMLAPLVAAHVPIIHVYGNADTALSNEANTGALRDRYIGLGGDFVLIIKEGCPHHPHGLSDPTPIADFIVAHATDGPAASAAALAALTPGTVVTLPEGAW